MYGVKRAALVAPVLLAACGGGDSNEVSTPAPVALASLNVTLSPAMQTTTISDDGTGTALSFTATVAGTTTDAVVADLQYDRTQLAQNGAVLRGPDGNYRASFRPLKTLPLGSYTGSVTFRLCRETACNTVYPGSLQTFGYSLTTRIGDWTTYQRNASHNGYVRATYNPADFRQAWEWGPSDVMRVTSAASHDALAYVVTQQTDGTAVLRALSSQDGAERWSYAIGSTTYFSPPAVGNGRVFVTTMTVSSDENPIISVDALTGVFKPPRALFSSQWSQFLSPTPFEDGLYMSAGYYGNVVYGFDYTARTGWGAEGGGEIWGGQTPAVDDNSVYYYSGRTLDIIDRRTGDVKSSLDDPFYQRSFYDYYGSPIIGSNGNVMAYSSQRGATTPSILVSWLIAAKAYAWRSSGTYSTAPAVGGGRVYLSRANPSELNALDEETGTVLWGWVPPAGERMIGNTILTETLVFVSTDRAVYAIPVSGSSHAPVWSAPGGGEMALTADGMLLVTRRQPSEPELSYPRTLTAYRLRP